jgi:hypothetical protein
LMTKLWHYNQFLELWKVWPKTYNFQSLIWIWLLFLWCYRTSRWGCGTGQWADRHKGDRHEQLSCTVHHCASVPTRLPGGSLCWESCVSRTGCLSPQVWQFILIMAFQDTVLSSVLYTLSRCCGIWFQASHGLTVQCWWGQRLCHCHWGVGKSWGPGVIAYCRCTFVITLCCTYW